MDLHYKTVSLGALEYVEMQNLCNSLAIIMYILTKPTANMLNFFAVCELNGNEHFRHFCGIGHDRHRSRDDRCRCSGQGIATAELLC